MRFLTPFAPLILKHRAARGKENPARMGEKLGHPSASRLPGPLIWFHGASIGEALSLLPLIERLEHATGATPLVTTGTVTSAQILKDRLSERAIHQFAPFDAPAIVARFLDHWRPAMVVFAESEIWPNTIRDLADRNIPLTLVNGRLSARSAARWKKVRRFATSVFGRFDIVLAQSGTDAARFETCGASRVQSLGNLKYDAATDTPDDGALRATRDAIGERRVLLGISTHPGEEAALFAAYRTLKPDFPDLLCITVPRHPERGPEILGESAGLSVAIRSRMETPTLDVDIWLLDTVGEMSLALSVATIAILGKSFGVSPTGGGQNPIEAAFAGVPLVCGPDVANFADVITALHEADGVLSVSGVGEMTDACRSLLANPDAAHAMAERARTAAGALTGATDRTFEVLLPIYQGAIG